MRSTGIKPMGMTAARAKRPLRGVKPETTRSAAQLAGLEKARAAKAAKAAKRAGTVSGGAALDPEIELEIDEERAPLAVSRVESLIEVFAERWNKISSQGQADRLRAEIEHAATTLAAEELLAFAAAPALRGRLLLLCVSARAEERATEPRSSAGAAPEHHDGVAWSRLPAPRSKG